MATGRPAARPAGEGATGTRVRRLYLDNLKTLLIALTIVVHGVIGYADFPGAWPYSDVHEVHLAWPTVVTVFGLTGPFLLVMMALLFLVAGLLAPASLARKGPRRFARDRLVRLGIPYLAFLLLLWPALEYALYRPLHHVSGSYPAFFAAVFPDSGPTWFIGLLLLASLGWAAAAARRRPGAPPPGPITGADLAGVAALIAGTSFVIRLELPYGSPTPLSLNEWQWPECLALFGIGVVAARQGWLAAVPAATARAARSATLLTAAAMAVFLVGSLPLHLEPADLLGGPHWTALAVDVFEGLLTVFGSIWLLALAQRHLDRPLGGGPALARSAYAAFLLQGFVLVGLAVALRPVPLPAGAKAAAVVVLGVVLCFAGGRLLVTRVPLLRRVL